MFNLIPKRLPSINLLYGKRPLQRIYVGHGKNQLEIPLPVIDTLYTQVDDSKCYHYGGFQPLQWKFFVDLKLKAYYLYEAFHSKKATRTALRHLHFYPKLTATYWVQLRNRQTDIAEVLNKPVRFQLPVQKMNI